MNERIKELAEQAGCVQHGVVWLGNNSDFERFAELIRQDEREACAKLCEEQDEYGCGQYAKAIRGRTE
jgi:hypothetical protein